MATPTTLPSTFVAGNVLTAAEMNNLRGAFRVLQVVQTLKTDTFTATVGTTATDITGLSVTITPSSTSSKVLVFANMAHGQNTAGCFVLVRGATAIALGDTAGSRQRVTMGASAAVGNNAQGSSSLCVLDSPATTSATTYKMQYTGDQAGSFFALNRGFTDTDNVAHFRASSTITVMEISA